MRYFSLNLEAQSPLAIRSDHAAVGAGNAGYIAGSALAGSLAHTYRLFYPEDTAMFERLFLSGQVRYPDLYPAMFQSEGMREALTLPVYPLPKTAQSCKRFPGFYPVKGEEADDDRHGVRDTLLDWAMFELGRQARMKEGHQPIPTAALLAPLEEHKKCHCGRPMDHFSGFYRRDDSLTDKNMSKASLETRLQAHTGINRETGTVQEGILYHRRVFEEQARFWGLLKISDELADPFAAFIEEIGRSGLVRIGTSRTRGMGKVSLSVEEMDQRQDRYLQFRQRVEQFSALVRDQASKMFSPTTYDLTPDPFYFALTLHSPLIFCDEMLRFRGTIDGKALQDLLHIPAESFGLIYQAAGTRRVSGWNELWGTPRTNEYAIESGSVFLFATTIEPAEALWQALFKVEEEGAGRRTTEGFGRVCVSDPFHREVSWK